MIELQSVCKRYGQDAALALDRIDLLVHSGERIAIRGPSGSGKTSLLNLIAAIDTPTSGRILVDGEDLATLTPLWRFRARRIGLVFQFHYLLPHLSAFENVTLPLYASGCSRRARASAAESALELVGLIDKRNRRPGELSGGERQLVALARALVNRPAVILADEPTGSLDADNAERVVDLLLDYCDRHSATLLLATHNDALAARLSRAVALRHGRFDATGSLDPVSAPVGSS